MKFLLLCLGLFCISEHHLSHSSTIPDSPEKIQKLNKAALDNYREGWAVGNATIVTRMSPDSFTFTWVPDSQVVSRKEFSDFFNLFMAGAEDEGRPKYNMTFSNIIQRTLGDTTFEAAEWIIEDYYKGLHMACATNGKIVWDLASSE